MHTQDIPSRPNSRKRFASAVGALLRHRYLPGLAALLAVLLTLPSLKGGWTLDDFYHREVLLGTSRFRFGPPDEMFRFLNGDPERTGRGMDIGLLPWWTYPRLKIEFLHVLSVMTFRLDYWLWPDSPAMMHAHSLLWFAALVAVTACFYRRMFGPTWLAGVAALLFALDDARGTTVGWLANRNSLVSVFFGVSALISHDQWRRDARRIGMILASLLFGASLLSKEEGIATCAYLFAYALFIDPAGRWRGGLALVPYAGMVLAWRVLRAHWGYGVEEMGLYIDPLTDPARFAVALVDRVPLFLLGQWGLPPSDVAHWVRPQVREVLWWVAASSVVLLAFALAPLLRRDRLARFWATGMLLSVIPVCATTPADRLLTFAGIGAFGLLAQFWGLVFGRDQWPISGGWRIPAVALGGAFLIIHLVLAPIALPLRASNPLGLEHLEKSLMQVPLGPSVEERTVVIVNAPIPLQACYLPIRRELSGLPVPRHTRVLSPGLHSASIRRPDEKTLAIRPAYGYLYWPLDRLFRSERRPMPLGSRVELTGMTVEVTALTDDGRPAEATFRFDVPLEDDSLRWICYRDGAFRPFTPPIVGEAVVIHQDGPQRLSTAPSH